ncbi:MAG TPA: DUF2617 family protein [Pseudonocardia sp.]|nr:DUF2617 family protein [Pseudonocardia sp.]
MTRHLLDVAPRDVRADALGLLLQAPTPPALVELALDDRRGGTLTLGVLGASHAVSATRPGHRLTEQVSCDAVAAGGQPLPRRTRTGGYELTSVITAVPRAELQDTALRLGELAEGQDSWLCGTFPGTRDALTALTGSALPGGGWTWETWHLYPGEENGVIVTTRSRWVP